MAHLNWQNTHFLKTAVSPTQYPKLFHSTGEPLPHVAVAGRSNVGKSSLLNDLFMHKGLVKTSSTPGKTQHINFFVTDEKIVFVDLPGYGYAKVPQEVKKEWGPMVQNYFEKAKGLSLLLFLLDLRRMPNQEDLQLLTWAHWAKCPVLFVFAKADKVTASERQRQMKAVSEFLPYENVPMLLHSSKTHLGREELRTKILTNVLENVL